MYTSKGTTAFALIWLGSFALLAHAGSEPRATSAATKVPPVVASLMTKELPDIPGKEAQMILVEYPPGGADPVHRHDADAFVYVLEGAVVMQVEGGKQVLLAAGQTFYEGPADVHTVGRNASQELPAKFLVVLLKNKGAPALLPVH